MFSKTEDMPIAGLKKFFRRSRKIRRILFPTRDPYPYVRCDRCHTWTREHIYLFEQYHKCCMTDWGTVHHINNIPTDNRIENLQGVSIRQHSIITNSGRRASPEYRKRLSIAQKGKHKRNAGSFLKGLIPWNKGKPWSEESKKKMSLAKIGKPRKKNT